MVVPETSRWYRYKQDTLVITQWLSKFKQQPRLKGKERKAVKAGTADAQHYLLSTSEMLEIAKTLQSCTPPPPVELRIKEALDSAIHLRKEQRQIFESVSFPISDEDDASHAYFVYVLETVKLVIDKLPVSDKDTQPRPSKTAKKENKKPVPASATYTKDIANQFEHLQMHELPDDEDFAELSGQSPVRLPKVDYNIKDDPQAAQIAVALFMKDMRDFYTCASRMMERYRLGDTDISSTGLIVNTMVMFLRTSEAEIGDLIEKCGGSEAVLEARYRNILANTPTNKAQDLCEPAADDLIEVGLLYQPETEFDTALTAIGRFWNTTVQQDRKLYAHRFPKATDGLVEWQTLSHRQRYETEIDVLSFFARTKAVKALLQGLPFLQKDVISEAVYSLNTCRCSPRKPFWALLAVKLLLDSSRWGARAGDAWKTLGNVLHGHRDALSEHRDFLGHEPFNVSTGPFARIRERCKSLIELVDVGIVAHQGVFIHAYPFTRNPIACGMWLCFLRMWKFKQSLSMVNVTGGILNMVQLTMALQDFNTQEGKSARDLHWSDIEAVGTGFHLRDFYEAKPGKDSVELLKHHYNRSLLAMGVSAVNFAHDRRDKTKVARRSDATSRCIGSVTDHAPVLGAFVRIYDSDFERRDPGAVAASIFYDDYTQQTAFSTFELDSVLSKVTYHKLLQQRNRAGFLARGGGKATPFMLFDWLLFESRVDLSRAGFDMLPLEREAMLVYAAIRVAAGQYLLDAPTKPEGSTHDPYRLNHEIFRRSIEQPSREQTASLLEMVKQPIVDHIKRTGGVKTSAAIATQFQSDRGSAVSLSFLEVPQYDLHPDTKEFILMSDEQWQRAEADRRQKTATARLEPQGS